MLLLVLIFGAIIGYHFGFLRGEMVGFKQGKFIGKMRWKAEAHMWRESVGSETGKKAKRRRNNWPTILEDE